LTDKITRGKPDSKIGFSLIGWDYINVILSQPIKPMPMDSFTNNYDVVITLLISGILGALGQGIRVWFGLSELIYNKSSLAHAAFVGTMSSGSIFVGFAAGSSFSLLRIFPQGHTLISMAMTIVLGYLVADLLEIVRNRRHTLFL